MKRRLFKILFIVCIFTNVNADENILLKNYLGFGIKYNTLKETVLQSSLKISELNWNTAIVPYIFDELILKLFDFNFLLGINTVIPVKSGYVTDSDWLFVDKSLLSNYSYHENFIDKNYMFYLKVSYTIPIFLAKFLIQQGLGIMYINEKYSAKNGYYQYSLNENKAVSSNTQKTQLCGTIMSYEISTFLPVCFTNIKIKLSEKQRLFFNLDLFPYMFIDSIDTHILRLVEFYDSMRGGYGFTLETGYVYRFTKTFELALSISCLLLKISGISGSRVIGESSIIERNKEIQSNLKKSSWEIKIGLLQRFN